MDVLEGRLVLMRAADDHTQPFGGPCGGRKSLPDARLLVIQKCCHLPVRRHDVAIHC